MTASYSPLAVILAVSAAGCVDLRRPDPIVQYIAFGDSATRGPSQRDYPEFLADELGLSHDLFANEGNSSESSGDGLDRLVRVLDLYPNAGVLLYWQGGRDLSEFIESHDPFLLQDPRAQGYSFEPQLAQALENTRENVSAAMATALENGLRAYMATYFLLMEESMFCEAVPLNVMVPQQARHANAYIELLNDVIREVAEQHSAVVVDVEALIVPDAALFENCTHLSANGNLVVGEAFASAIRAQGD